MQASEQVDAKLERSELTERMRRERSEVGA